MTVKKTDLLAKYKFLEYKEEKYKCMKEEKDQIVNKYYYNKSFLKTYFHPQSNFEVLVCAMICDSNFILRDKIQVGMKKESLLELLFNTSP